MPSRRGCLFLFVAFVESNGFVAFVGFVELIDLRLLAVQTDDD